MKLQVFMHVSAEGTCACFALEVVNFASSQRQELHHLSRNLWSSQSLINLGQVWWLLIMVTTHSGCQDALQTTQASDLFRLENLPRQFMPAVEHSSLQVQITSRPVHVLTSRGWLLSGLHPGTFVMCNVICPSVSLSVRIWEAKTWKRQTELSTFSILNGGRK